MFPHLLWWWSLFQFWRLSIFLAALLSKRQIVFDKSLLKLCITLLAGTCTTSNYTQYQGKTLSCERRLLTMFVNRIFTLTGDVYSNNLFLVIVLNLNVECSQKDATQDVRKTHTNEVSSEVACPIYGFNSGRLLNVLRIRRLSVSRMYLASRRVVQDWVQNPNGHKSTVRDTCRPNFALAYWIHLPSCCVSAQFANCSDSTKRVLRADRILLVCVLISAACREFWRRVRSNENPFAESYSENGRWSDAH